MTGPYEIADLRAFAAVAHERSFSRAARRLYRTQPTVTMAVQRLERRTGCRLLDRTPRSVSLTPEGALLLAEASPLLDRWEALPARFREARSGEVAGTVRVVADEAALVHLLPPVIRSFRKWHPAVTIDVRAAASEDAFALVRRGEADLSLAAEDGPSPGGAEALASLRSERLLLFPGAHPLAAVPRPSLRAIAAGALLLTPRGSRTREAVDAALRRAGLLTAVTELPTWEAVRTYSGLGIGIGVAPACTLHGTDRRLVLRKAGSLFGHELFVLSRRRAQTPTPAARAFAERAAAHVVHLGETGTASPIPARA